MFRYVYTGLLYLSLPLILVRLALRGFKNKAYWSRWGERFGRVAVEPGGVWFHAVSVGEVQAAAPLIESLLPADILVTTTTPTGSDQLKRLFPRGVKHCYAPYDYPGAVKRFLNRAQPRSLVILETEIWPNIIRACHDRGVKVAIVNLRLSRRSYKRYARAKEFMASVLGQVDAFGVQSRSDAGRLLELGADPNAVRVTGSIKFEVELPASLTEVARVLRRDWGRNRPVWIAGSTRECEDELILDAFQKLLESHPNLLLVIVPRHPERFPAVAKLCRRRHLRFVRRSAGRGHIGADVQIYLGDTMGELGLMYAASDIAFVGGSLVRAGGQNLLEPCALGLPVLFGPYMRNFLQISEMVVEHGAGSQVMDAPDVVQAVDRYLRDANLRFTTGERGREMVQENRGALNETLEVLQEVGIDRNVNAG